MVCGHVAVLLDRAVIRGDGAGITVSTTTLGQFEERKNGA
jgi:hypothetical protein